MRAALLQHLLDELLIGVIVVDAQARLSFVNRQARDLLARHDGLIDAPAGLKAGTAAHTRRLRHAVALMAASGHTDDTPALTRYLGLPRRSRRAAPCCCACRRCPARRPRWCCSSRLLNICAPCRRKP